MRYAHVLSSYNHTGTSESVEMTCQKCQKCQMSIMSGQIIATSHDLSPLNGGDCKGNPLISGKSRLVKYYNLARCMVYLPTFG